MPSMSARLSDAPLGAIRACMGGDSGARMVRNGTECRHSISALKWEYLEYPWRPQRCARACPSDPRCRRRPPNYTGPRCATIAAVAIQRLAPRVVIPLLLVEHKGGAATVRSYPTRSPRCSSRVIDGTDLLGTVRATSATTQTASHEPARPGVAGRLQVDILTDISTTRRTITVGFSIRQTEQARLEHLVEVFGGGNRSEFLRMAMDRMDVAGRAQRLRSIQEFGSQQSSELGISADEVSARVKRVLARRATV